MKIDLYKKKIKNLFWVSAFTAVLDYPLAYFFNWDLDWLYFIGLMNIFIYFGLVRKLRLVNWRDMLLVIIGLFVSLVILLSWLVKPFEVNTLLMITIWQSVLFIALFFALWIIPYSCGSMALKNEFEEKLVLK